MSGGVQNKDLEIGRYYGQRNGKLIERKRALLEQEHCLNTLK